MQRVRVANIPLPVFVSLRFVAGCFPFFPSDFQSFNLSVVAGTVLGLGDI